MLKVNFSSIPSHNKKVASTNVNPTKEECRTIYENIKNNKTIYNPNTKRKLKYNSPITQKILQECYIKYKMKELPNVIDPKNLFGNKTPPALSPNSPPKQPSPPALSPKSPPKQPSPPALSPKSPPKQPSPPGVMPKSPPKQPSPPGVMPKSPPKQPSPPGVMPKSPPKQPSPPALSPKSPAKVKKLSFEGVSDTIKTTAQKEPYNNLTTNNCMYVVDQCKDVMQKIANGNTKKHQITNPVSKKGILYNSPITKYLLYSCYYDKNIKEVEDVVDIKTLCDRPPTIKNNYNDILTKCKDLKLNYTETKLNDLFVETELDAIYLTYFKDYIKSCSQIEKKQSIDFDTVCKHIRIILNLLRVGNSESTIALYDDKFLDDLRSSGYASKNIVENKLPLSYSHMNLYNYTDIVSGYNAIDIADTKTILLNYIFNRIYVFQYNDMYDNIIELYPESRILIDSLDDIGTLIKKNNKIVPKYFAHSYQDDTETNNKLNYITAFLTEFASDIVSNIEIIEPKSADKITELEQKIPSIKRNECYDLATILYHNTIFNSNNINTPIVGPFDGTVNRSTVNAFQYLFKLIDFQAYNLDIGTIHRIQSNYKNDGRLPLSKNLNIELSNLILDPNFTLSSSVKRRLIIMLISMQARTKEIHYTKSLFLFHGTSNKLNSDLLTSFLSTTFNIDTAVHYSYNNANPHIYIFRINSNNIKYINFNDGLHQVLLLPGTKIIEQCTLKYHNYTFIVCDLEITNNIYLLNILNNIQTYTSRYTIKDYLLTVKNYTDDYIKVVSYNPANLDFLSPFRNSNYINITDDNKYLTCELLAETSLVNNLFLNLKYSIHQLIINNIYSYFMNDKIINYNFIYFNLNITTDNNILVGWEYDSSLKSTLSNPNYKYDYDFLIIDLLCNNFDLANNLSYLLTTDNKVKKVWFKTTGIFNGVACQTITEDDSKNIAELTAKFKKDINTIIETNIIFNNNKTDITPFVNKYMNLIHQFKTDKILDKIITSFEYFIDNVLNIPHTSEEYRQLKIFIEIIKRYFNAKVDYMLSLDRTDLITTINSKMTLTGGKDKKLSSDSPKISKKSKSSSKNLIIGTDPTTFDKEGYEITPQYYSSTHTISSSSLKSIKIFRKLRN
jgi:hypothetical protein